MSFLLYFFVSILVEYYTIFLYTLNINFSSSLLKKSDYLARLFYFILFFNPNYFFLAYLIESNATAATIIIPLMIYCQ